MLYSRYASPMELIRVYIDQGRFGEFVSEVIRMDTERKQEKIEKEEDSKLWIAYLLEMQTDRILGNPQGISFNKWKERIVMRQQSRNNEPETLEMTNEQVDAIKNKARGILAGFSPT